jgi:hypothetical protein
MKRFTMFLQTTIKESLNIREMDGNKFVPSEPGTPPHKRTGNLYRSVYQRTESEGGMIVTGVVGANAQSRQGFPYAAIHEDPEELGSSTVPPRPYIRPAVERNAKSFETMFAGIMEKI